MRPSPLLPPSKASQLDWAPSTCLQVCGLDWTGLDWTGLGWAGLGWAGLDAILESGRSTLAVFS